MNTTKSFISLFTTCTLFIIGNLQSEIPFELTDTHPSHPDFKNNILGLYGVNSAIEPQITNKEKPTYEKVAPHLQDNPDQAIQILFDTLKPESNAAFDYLLGMLYYQKNDYNNAITSLDKAIEKFPTFRRALRLKAYATIHQNQYKASQKQLVKVIKLGGGDEQTYGLLAYTYIQQEEYASALEAYQSARMFNPDKTDFKLGLADCYLNLNENKKAIGLLDELIKDNPNDKRLWLAQANAYLDEGQYSEAIANYEILRSLNKADFKVLALLSEIYLQEGIQSLSLDALKASIPLLNSNEQNGKVLKLVENYLSLQWFDAAETILKLIPQTYLSNLSEEENTTWKLAQASLDLGVGRKEQAYQQLKSILEKAPLNGAALILLGNYYRDENQLDEAIFQYERASYLEKHKFKAFVALAELHVQKGDFESSLKVLYKAQAIKPSKNLLDYIQQVEKAYRSSF